MAFVRKRCGGKFEWSVLVDSSPKLIFGTLRYLKVLEVPSQLTCCVGDEGENHGVNEGDYRRRILLSPSNVLLHRAGP
jgi:hypothetical protein